MGNAASIKTATYSPTFDTTGAARWLVAFETHDGRTRVSRVVGTERQALNLLAKLAAS